MCVYFFSDHNVTDFSEHFSLQMRALLALVVIATAILAGDAILVPGCHPWCHREPGTKAAYKDLVRDLPGLDHPISFNQYSGYLMGDATTYIHYWFVFFNVKIKFSRI